MTRLLILALFAAALAAIVLAEDAYKRAAIPIKEPATQFPLCRVCGRLFDTPGHQNLLGGKVPPHFTFDAQGDCPGSLRLPKWVEWAPVGDGKMCHEWQVKTVKEAKDGLVVFP
jgi:hypothetical protein